jgi:hypothetical protein
MDPTSRAAIVSELAGRVGNYPKLKRLVEEMLFVQRADPKEIRDLKNRIAALERKPWYSSHSEDTLENRIRAHCYQNYESGHGTNVKELKRIFPKATKAQLDKALEDARSLMSINNEAVSLGYPFRCRFSNW